MKSGYNFSFWIPVFTGMTERMWLLLLCAICFSARASTNEFTTQIEQLSADIQRHQLDNGLVCLINEDCSAPLVSIQVWVGAGSAQEGEYLGGGLSHFIEHMIFKGTQKRKPADIAKEIDDAGGSINAYTSLDRTVFWVDMPAETWQKGLEVLADAALNASFPEDEWRREKDVIRREMAMGNDNPGNVLSKLLWQNAYHVHPYRFPVIGKEEIFKTLTRGDLLAFFRRHYTPDNMIVAVSGNIDPNLVRAEIERRFQCPGRRARPLPDQTVEPPQLSPRSARKTGVYNISRLEMAWHTVGLSHPDAPALDVLAVIAGGGTSSRLGQKIKESRKLAFNIDAWSYTPKDTGLFGINAAFDPAKEAELIKAIEEEVAGWRGDSMDGDSKVATKSTKNKDTKQEGCHSRGSGNPEQEKYLDSHFHGNDKADARRLEINPFTAAEVEKARNKITADTLMAFQTMHGTADTFASGEFYAGTPVYCITYLKRLAEVTPASLRTVAGKYLKDPNRTLAILSPAVTNGFAGETNNAPAEIKIVKRTFPNGLTLLCREDRRLPFVDFCVVLLGGLLMENEKNSGITCLTAELLTRGTQTRSQKEIAQTIESSGGAVSSFSGMNSFGLQSRCFSKDAGLFAEILSDCLINPSFPEEEIAKSKVIQIAMIEQQRESPMFLAQEAMRKALFAGHPYRLNAEGTRASVAAVSREDIFNLHRKTTAGSNTVIAVFGDISPDKAGEMAEKFFGKMAAGQRPEWRSLMVGREPQAPPDKDKNGGAGTHMPYPLKKIDLTSPREQTIVLAGFPGLAVTDERIDAFDIVLNALNGLSSDLMISVRDKKGLAYYTGAYHKAGLAGGQFVVYSGTRAEEAARVQALIIKEISRLAGKGLRAEELERARRQIITERRQNFQVNAGMALDCALNELYGMGYAHALEKEKRIGYISHDDVRKAAADILCPDKMVTVIVRPEKK